MKRTIMLVAIAMMAVAPTLTTATERGIRRTYGGDWLAKHRASVDRQGAAVTNKASDSGSRTDESRAGH